jgi:hypothetical protein
MFDPAKIAIIVLVVGLLWSSPRYRTMSRNLDQAAIAALKRMMCAAEESGYPSSLIPFLLVMTALMYALSSYLTTLYVR